MQRPLVLAVAAVGVGLFAGAAPAHAQDAAPPAVAPAPPPAVAPAPQPDPEEKPYKQFSVLFNPLSAIVGRYSFDLIYLPARHHGIVFNPYGQFVSAEAGSVKTEYSNYGAELGYRFFTGERGANGFFIGPFATYTAYNTKTTSGGTSAEASFRAYGVGADLGGMHVFDFGLTIGGGFGLMWLRGSGGDGAATSSTVKVEGVLPRFLFSIGYSF